ncbi:hypothetical protein I7F13_27200 [Sinorhizobium meliloti]|uniref:hypothetical protein n=1 Tax=Rhizobium meliloti TaxID=382 RepID=UPI000FDC22A1|nr:hypothetical protein [Sinorhizobium meliloti]MDE3825842.1 hypothetical protein [Sinorhizobium meliloti]RVM35641.1 hypothetical protein CN127_36575 [Sinorhizobium meliloti]RVN52500.1 hypothetical protein CN106_36870 [Sinorhizobium meliloti]
MDKTVPLGAAILFLSNKVNHEQTVQSLQRRLKKAPFPPRLAASVNSNAQTPGPFYRLERGGLLLS